MMLVTCIDFIFYNNAMLAIGKINIYSATFTISLPTYIFLYFYRSDSRV